MLPESRRVGLSRRKWQSILRPNQRPLRGAERTFKPQVACVNPFPTTPPTHTHTGCIPEQPHKWLVDLTLGRLHLLLAPPTVQSRVCLFFLGFPYFGSFGLVNVVDW